MSETNTIRSKCEICSVPASNSHYGVTSCEPCKVFFRRNMTKVQRTLKCLYDGLCEINIHNRHVCPACRLKKCITAGMSADFIRGPRGKTQKIVKKVSEVIPSSSCQTDSQSYQLRPLNLLERDYSSLTNDQWNLLSNLVHSYDEHTTLPVLKNFAKELESKPVKLRFKITVNELMNVCAVLCQETEPFIRSNQDFSHLPANDRSVVLYGAAESVSCLGASFLLRQSGLIADAAFRQALENTFGPIPFSLTMTMVSSLDQDPDLVKLTLSLLAFTTSSCTIFDENIPYSCVKDNRTLLRIQNIYAEAIWRYLVYRYTYCEAVMRFTHLVQCVVVTLTMKTHLQAVKQHRDVIDSLIERIEQHHQMDISDT